MEIISTRKFTVFERTDRNDVQRRGLDSSENLRPSVENVRRTAGAGPLAAPLAFEKDGVSIEVPNMRLRELNKGNAARCDRLKLA